LTHPERILWEEAGLTKQGLAEFYTEIADWILPHLAGRPLSLLRCPSGTGAKGFFAKHPWQGLDTSIRRVDTRDKEPMVAIGDVTGLFSLVQAGVVEIHPWGSSIDNLEQQDRLIFDLDPGENVLGRRSSKRPMTCATGLPHLVCKVLSRLQVVKGFTSWCPFNRQTSGTRSRHSRKRLQERWPRRGQTVMSPQLRSGHAALAFLLIIFETTAAPPR
jgi:DNA ligase D-like protein (predicted polymerase)